MKAEVEEVALEDARSGGDQVVTPQRRAMDGASATPTSGISAVFRNPPSGEGSAGQWVLPRCPPFYICRHLVCYPALGISPSFAPPDPEQGGGGASGTREGHGHESRIAPSWALWAPLDQSPISMY